MDTELRLKSINSLAQVVRAQRADVKADYVLGIGGFDLDRVADEVRTLLHLTACPTVRYWISLGQLWPSCTLP